MPTVRYGTSNAGALIGHVTEGEYPVTHVGGVYAERARVFLLASAVAASHETAASSLKTVTCAFQTDNE